LIENISAEVLFYV